MVSDSLYVAEMGRLVVYLCCGVYVDVVIPRTLFVVHLCAYNPCVWAFSGLVEVYVNGKGVHTVLSEESISSSIKSRSHADAILERDNSSKLLKSTNGYQHALANRKATSESKCASHWFEASPPQPLTRRHPRHCPPH